MNFCKLCLLVFCGTDGPHSLHELYFALGFFCFLVFSCGTDTTSCMNTPSLFALVGHLRLHDHILHGHSKIVFFGGTIKTSCPHELAPTPFA